jgi:hypothetical protein
MKKTARWSLAAAVGGLVLALGPWALADSKEECSAAYDATQVLRDQGKLLDARKQALACTASMCSPYVVKDCVRWVSEIEASLPSVVFTAQNSAGEDTLAVRVLVDHRLLAERLDGNAVLLDPGEHAIRLEMEGASPIEQKVLLALGQKNRNVSVVFKANAAPAKAGAPSSTAPGATRRLVGGLLMGTGAAGLLVGAVAGGVAIGEHLSFGGTQAQVNRYYSTATVADLGFIGGGAIGLTGLVIFLTAPTPPATTGGSVTVRVGVGTVELGGRF